MRFEPELIPATLLRRYKRFLADVRLADGTEITVHCPDPGAMTRIAIPGRPIALSHSTNPRRKLAYTWEMIELEAGWVGIHTGRTNSLVEEALRASAIPELCAEPGASTPGGFDEIRREVRVGQSRLDFALDYPAGPSRFVEVKTVTLTDGGRRAMFPDSVTVRGQKHVEELRQIAAEGRHRAVMLFWVNRGDCDEFAPADEIDPEYGKLLRRAASEGVEVLAYRAEVGPKQVTVDRSIPIVL